MSFMDHNDFEMNLVEFLLACKCFMIRIHNLDRIENIEILSHVVYCKAF